MTPSDVFAVWATVQMIASLVLMTLANGPKKKLRLDRQGSSRSRKR